MININWSLLIKGTIDDVHFWGGVLAQDKVDDEFDELRQFGPCQPWLKNEPVEYTQSNAVSYLLSESNVDHKLFFKVANGLLEVPKDSELESRLALLAAKCSPMALCKKCGIPCDMIEKSTITSLGGCLVGSGKGDIGDVLYG